jgi:uncharacterized protein (TIGR03437 family)
MSRSLSVGFAFLFATAAHASMQAYGPTFFEPNLGQAADRVCYLSRAPGYTLLLRSGEFEVDSRDSPALRVRLAGANPRARFEGLDRLPGISNYFFGNDPAKWRTGIPNYRGVALREVYPGIDLVFYANQGELEYDWIVAPGADPNRIRLKLDGAKAAGLDTAGDLLLNASIRQKKPVVYQNIEGGRKEVEGGYEVRGGEVRFRMAAYDRRLPLVIDPVLVYSTFLGGRGMSNIAEAVAVDRAGNAYVTGYTDSPNFPVRGPVLATSPGVVTPFVTKVSPDGALIYSTFFGEYPFDQAHGIAVDAAGNAYVAGITGSPNFPVVNALQPKPAGGSDMFVTKISPDGSRLLYSTYLGGSGADYGLAIAVDPAGNACVTGYTFSSDFPTVNALQASSGGLIDAFVTRISADGASLIYSTYLGGKGSDYATDVATDADGNAYVSGFTNSADFPLVNPLISKTGGALWDGFVVKLGADGSAVYSTYLGGKSANALSGDRAYCIAADLGGNAYVEGYTSSPDFPSGPNGPAGSGNTQTYVTKIDPAGSTIIYTAYIPGTTVGASSLQERNCGLAVDLAGNAYAAGAAYSANFPATPDAIQAAYAGGGIPSVNNVFLTKLSADGSHALYSTYMGGSKGDNATGLAVRGSDIYLAGFSWSKEFPTADATQTRGPYGDVFVTRIAGDGPQVQTVVNGASGLAGPIAPGEWITIGGVQLGPPGGANYTINADGSIDSSLGSVQVLFDNIPGTPTYVSDGQINVIAPYEISGRASTDVFVIYQQAVSRPAAQSVRAESPAIFTLDSSGRGQAKATNEDGTPNGPVGDVIGPAAPDSVISVYGTGGGQTDPSSVTGSVTPAGTLLPLANWSPGSGTVTATIGGKPATVVFAGASPADLTGVLRVDIRIPAGVTGLAIPITIAINGISSPAGPTISVQ